MRVREAHRPPSETSSPIACSFFQRGSCTFGASCRYSHGNLSPDPSTVQPTVCIHFVRGTCRFGSRCLQSHDLSQKVGATTPNSLQARGKDSPILPPQSNTSNKLTCKFFLEGRCTKGSTCPFKHPEGANSTSPRSPQPAELSWRRSSVASLSVTQDTPPTSPVHPIKSNLEGMAQRQPYSLLKEPCIYFSQGMCTKGEFCPFLHVKKSPHDYNIQHGETSQHAHPTDERKPANPSPSLVASDTPEREFEPGEGHTLTPSSITVRSILHCEVQFGPGASVKQISTPFESCHVILSNLPQSITQDDMLTLTQPLDGLIKFNFFESTATATLQFVDCDHAARAVRYLDCRPYGLTRLAARLNLRATVENGSGTLLSCRVKLSWFAPSLVAWANYNSLSHAQKVVEMLKTKPFDGRLLSASLRAPRRGFGVSSWNSNPVIKIKGLPLGTNIEHLQRFAQSGTITLGYPTYNRDEGLEDLRLFLTRYGPLASFDMLPVDNKKPKLTAFAQFSTADSAAKAAKEIHNTKHDFLGGNLLWVEQIHSVKYAIPRGQFVTTKDDLDRLQAIHDVSKLRYYDRDQNGSPTDPVCIRIYGPDPKSLGSLKADVERVFQGELFVLDEKSVWDEYFNTKDGMQFIKDLNTRSTESFIKCDDRSRTMRLFGSPRSREGIKGLITRHLEDVIAGRHVLLLGKEKLRGLLTGGLKALEDEIGKDKIVLDVVGLTLTIRGDEEELRKVSRTIAAMDDLPIQAATHASMAELCPVCFCGVSDPIKLPCGHSYCLMCLQHLLLSHAQPGSNFSVIKCVAEVQGRVNDTDAKSKPPCGENVPNDTIRQLLTPSEETMLFERSFISHIHARPKEFRYCPTPDCKVIYRHRDDDDDGMVLQCLACLARVCARCHIEFHEGLTCTEYIDASRCGLEGLQRWKAANDVKSCPNCKADLEKNGGCNHITCASCGTHMCWVCMKTFLTGPKVYEHMNRVHNSIGLDHLLDI